MPTDKSFSCRTTEAEATTLRSFSTSILRMSLFLGLVAGLLPVKATNAQTMINTANRGTSVTDSFYERTGVSWGMNFGNPNGNGSRGFGSFNFNAPAIPAFGGYTPNSGAQFGFARTGNPGFHFGLTMASGSNRSLVSSSVSTTSLNGYPSSIFSGFAQPFVTGYVPVVTQYSGYGGYGLPGYGGGYGVPYRYPYAYQVTVERHSGRSQSQMLRDAGHVGAHDHGHRHHNEGNHSLGGNHYYFTPLYSPYCAPACLPVPYAAPLYGYGYPAFGYPAYGISPYANAGYPATVSLSSINPVGATTVYADSYGNQSAVPFSGSVAAAMLNAQADAKKKWANGDAPAVSTKRTVGASLPNSDPLGQSLVSTETVSDPSSVRPSSATTPAESLTKIRKRQQETQRIADQLRRAAVQRLMDQSRQAYSEDNVSKAIELANTALERCGPQDTQLRESILRGIEKMKEK